jgi:glycosyltransferase involved in cell wall biosynthesis
MANVLYIARYHNPIMERKIALMATQSDLSFCLARPSHWQDEYGQVAVPILPDQPYKTLAVPLLFRPTDWHRALYGTLTFKIAEFRPDLIHAEEEPESLAALQILLARRLFAPKARVILHTWQNINRPKRWYVWWVARTAFRYADAILCANREGVSVLREMGYAGPSAVIPHHGVHLGVFRPQASARTSSQFTIAFVGRFAPEKGLDTLLEAVCLLGSTVRLLLVGAGPHRQTLEDQIYAMGLSHQVQFVDPLANDKLPGLFAEIDVLVLPSRTMSFWKEQFGRVLVEAMACKVPVVGSDSGAIPEVIGDAGLIFPEGDAIALADCLHQLIGSADLGHDLAERGYQRVQRLYSQECIAEQTIAFYRSILPTSKVIQG